MECSIPVCVGCDGRLHGHGVDCGAGDGMTQHSSAHHRRVSMRHVLAALPFCDYCEWRPASVYCDLDGVTLCLKCDREAHPKKSSRRKHERRPIAATMLERPFTFVGGKRKNIEGLGDDSDEVIDDGSLVEPPTSPPSSPTPEPAGDHQIPAVTDEPSGVAAAAERDSDRKMISSGMKSATARKPLPAPEPPRKKARWNDEIFAQANEPDGFLPPSKSDESDGIREADATEPTKPDGPSSGNGTGGSNEDDAPSSNDGNGSEKNDAFPKSETGSAGSRSGHGSNSSGAVSGNRKKNCGKSDLPPPSRQPSPGASTERTASGSRSG